MDRSRRVSKVLSANDLGLTGTHQAGIAIPKDPEILAFFPSLDGSEYNPDCEMAVSTPDTSMHWSLRFVYYNSKTHGMGTRNEYRLTGTTKMLRDMAPRVGDSISFMRNDFGDIEISIQASESELDTSATTKTLKGGWRLTITDSEE
ncbi:EcoRII N-terminal effector-binding domain-containing protein [Terrabacter sp. 2YAF2]|uniref:EcoRII N-terminal effector-binding domain-containing protein n=1 Tax=Terrabacter sp. 2YAF2 TaxID=3233026 RepID=UPI003F979685